MISFGAHRLGAAGDLVHVDELVVLAHGVVLGPKPLARHVDVRAVGQMPAGGEVEAQKRVAGLQQRQKHRLVHLAAGIRLDVGEAAIEQFFGPLDRQALGDVDELAAAVIAPAGIALGIFVGHHRALRLEDGAGDDVFRRDELDLVALAPEFLVDRAGDFGIGLGEGGLEEAVGVARSGGGCGARGASWVMGRVLADSERWGKREESSRREALAILSERKPRSGGT